MMLTGDRRLGADMQAWLGLSPFARYASSRAEATAQGLGLNFRAPPRASPVGGSLSRVAGSEALSDASAHTYCSMFVLSHRTLNASGLGSTGIARVQIPGVLSGRGATTRLYFPVIYRRNVPKPVLTFLGKRRSAR